VKTELEKLRDEEARLEYEIAQEKGGSDFLTSNITSLTTQLSECKKAIGALTIGKMFTT
jgi:hypothetical protein